MSPAPSTLSFPEQVAILQASIGAAQVLARSDVRAAHRALRLALAEALREAGAPKR